MVARMRERLREVAPPADEQRRALVALWLVATVGAASFVAYDRSVPAADLPLVLVPVLYAALIGATVAIRGRG